MRVLNPLVFGAAIALSGCSLSLQFDCTEDGDCANLSGNFMCNGTVCVELEPDAAPDMMTEPEGFSCADDDELLNDNCVDLFGPLSGAPQATAEARLAVFLDNYEEYELIAVQVPNGPLVNTGQELITAVIHHAVDHINNSGGFTFGEELGQSKKLAALICYDALGDGGIAGGIAAAEHAVSCGAKALVSTYVSERTVDIFREVALPNNIPMISPGAISPQIPVTRDALGDEGLLWRIKVPGSTLVRSVVSLIETLNYQNVHILYRSETQYDATMYDQMDARLGNRLIGAYDLTPGQAGSSFDAVAGYLTGLAAEDRPGLVVSVVEDLNDLADVAIGVISAANTEPALEFDLITVEGARSSQAAVIVASQPNHQKISCRTMGISSGSTNGGATEAWRREIRLAAEDYSLTVEEINSELPAPTLTYVDGVFVTAYALASALRTGNGEATTLGIIDGLKLLSDGNASAVNPLRWTDGLDALGASGTGQMNYNGASGSIDLNPVSQDVDGRKTELWQYAFSGFEGSVVELGDLVSDDAEDYAPEAAALDALRQSHMSREECTDFPYLGTQ